MNEIQENIRRIKQRIKEACLVAGRNDSELKLLLATKTVSADRIKVALQSGEILIGENKVQELKQKFEALRSLPHETHFIGHLQSNKVKEVLKYADCIQSIDRISIVESMDRELQKMGRAMPVFVQVNTSREESKFGVTPENVLPFIRQIVRYDTLNIRGLMTIGLLGSDRAGAAKCFRLLKQKQIEIMELGLDGVNVAELSMGMSGDLDVAIEEGATMIRVGTAVFGSRIYPDSYYWNEKNTQ